MSQLHFLFVPVLTLLGFLAPGWLGVMLAEDDTGRPTVTEVVPDSPAAKAGIKAGDVIVALDDMVTDSVEKLVATVSAREAGTKVKVKVQRDGKEQVIEVELGKRPDDLASPRGAVRVAPPQRKVEEGKKEGSEKEETAKPPTKVEPKKAEPKTGQERTARPAARPFLGVALEEVDGGVQVTDVLDDSPAAKVGVGKGQLLAIGGTKIASLADVDRAMNSLRAGQTTKVTVRGDETRTFEVTLSEGPGARGKDDGGAVAAREEAVAKAKKDAAAAERVARQAVEKARNEAEKAARAAERAKAEAKEQPARRAAAAPAPAAEKVDVRAELREGKGKVPLLLVFGASWDPSTKALKKSLGEESVRAALGDRKVVWIDTDQYGAIADEYEVQQIPHMVLVDASGKRTGVIEGFQPAELLAQKLTASRTEAAPGTPAKRPSTGLVTRTVPRAEAGRPAAAKPETAAGPVDAARPAEKAAEKVTEKTEAARDLHAEIRALREEIRELRGLLQELTRERRR